QDKPYVFARLLTTDSLDDRVVVAMDQPKGLKHVPVASVFANGTLLTEAYSDSTVWVRKGVATVNSPYDLVLLSQFRQSESDTVVVVVTNDWELPMEVYAIGANTSYRMGTVNPGIPSRFVLRRDVLSTDRMIQFVAHATAYGRQAAAEPILITPGDVIDFEITSTLIGTHAAVRP
ncbi:MAG TPA: hypothetical protein VMH88_05065, partial [Gemmatimonadales bacterium]|nr:hypothetical protein [Gemmatimonadales bacterium]